MNCVNNYKKHLIYKGTEMCVIAEKKKIGVYLTMTNVLGVTRIPFESKLKAMLFLEQIKDQIPKHIGILSICGNTVRITTTEGREVYNIRIITTFPITMDYLEPVPFIECYAKKEYADQYLDIDIVLLIMLKNSKTKNRYPSYECMVKDTLHHTKFKDMDDEWLRKKIENVKQEDVKAAFLNEYFNIWTPSDTKTITGENKSNRN